MEIKRTGPPGFPLNARRTASIKPSGEPFRAPKPGQDERVRRIENVDALPRVSGEFSKAGMADPARLDLMIRSSLREMLEREFPQALNLSAPQKEFLSDWMARDPIIREKIVAHLERVLR